MTWKEFFRPSKSKVILFVIIFVLGFLNYKIATSFCSCDMGVFGIEQPAQVRSFQIPGQCCPVSNPNLVEWFLLIQSYVFFPTKYAIGFSNIIVSTIVNMLVLIPYWYLVSCLIGSLFGNKAKRQF